MTSLELKEKRAATWAALLDLRGQRVDGKFADAATETTYRKANEDFQAFSSQIIEAERFEAQQREMAEAEHETRSAKEKGATKGKDPAQGMSYDEVFWRYQTRGKNATLSPEEMRILETRGTSTQHTATNSLGGYTVPETFSGQLENMMKWYGGMLTACRSYDTPRGGTMRWPTGDDTAASGEIITTQSTAKTVLDTTFGQVTWGDYTLDSKIIKVSRELLQDEDVNLLQGVLLDNLSNRIGRKINSVLTTGTGTNEPYGLTTVVTNGTTVAGAAAITKKELINFTHSIDKAYRYGPNVGWMMNDTMLAYLRGLDVGNTDTVQIFYPSLVTGEPDRLLGFPIFINNDLTGTTAGVPVTATKHIFFGDFSKYIIRRISPVAIERNDHLYWETLTVGFMGWTRLDGNLINANAIKYLKQA